MIGPLEAIRYVRCVHSSSDTDQQDTGQALNQPGTFMNRSPMDKTDSLWSAFDQFPGAKVSLRLE